MISIPHWKICSSPACLSDHMPGSEYCRPCARKVSLEEYRKISSGHAALVAARDTGPDAIFAGVSPRDILFCLSEPDEASRGGRTYVIAFHRTIKIGYGSPVSRLCSLQTGNPKKLRILASIPSASMLERFLHKAFRQARLRGEWFRMTDLARELIKRMRADDLGGVCEMAAETIEKTDPKFFPRIKKQAWLAQGASDELV